MLRPADKLPTEMRLRLLRGGANDRASLASSLSATPLQEQHAALRSRNKPPDRIGRRLAFTLRKCQDKSRVEIVVGWKTFSHNCRKCRIGKLWRLACSWLFRAR